jgi:hypothetical protein
MLLPFIFKGVVKMDTSIFIARILGLYLIVLAIALLVNIRKLNAVMNDANLPYIFLSGAIATLTGTLIIVSHNIWEADWKVLITLIGWLAFIKGALRMIFPKRALKMITTFLKHKTRCYVTGVIVLILGVYLSYVGFMI